MLGVLLSIGVADMAGCPLDEGSVHPCVVAGTDLGDALNSGFVLGWLAFVTWPGMLVSLALWVWLSLRSLHKRLSA